MKLHISTSQFRATVTNTAGEPIYDINVGDYKLTFDISKGAEAVTACAAQLVAAGQQIAAAIEKAASEAGTPADAGQST